MEKKKVIMAQFVWLSLLLGDRHSKEENNSQEKWWVWNAPKNKKYENTGHFWMHPLAMNSEYHRRGIS